MKYFKDIKSFEDLKSQYRALARRYHPDAGGDAEAMKEINNLFDDLFIIWKRASKVETAETASKVRWEFYTQNGWRGENYDINITLKEIAVRVRNFAKTYYPDCKFSVTTEYASMCQSLNVYLMEGPYEAYKTREQWSNFEQMKAENIAIHCRNYNYTEEEIERKLQTAFMTPYIQEAVNAVQDYANSFNYDDCDSTIDYFNVNFWFNGVRIGKWNKDYKVVERKRNNKALQSA